MKRLLIIGLIVLVLIVGIGCSTKKETKTESQNSPVYQKKTYLPSKLAGLTLMNEITGPQAMKMISELHMGAKIALKKAFIGPYSSGGQQPEAMVWLSIAASQKSNEKLLKKMTDKISKGKSPFSKPVEKDVKGQKVYFLTGMGQNHYYFINGTKFAWLSVSENFADQALKELIESKSMK